MTTIRRSALSLPIALAAASLVLAACGGSSGGTATSSAATSSPSSASSSATAAPSGYVTNNCGTPDGSPSTSDTAPQGTDVDGVIIDDAKVPSITIGPDSAPSDSLVTKDLVEGSGAAVKPGATVTVNYCLVGQESRSLIDSSWARGTPLSIGLNQVIKGWSDGVPGMKPGGRRLLLIPGSQGYGPNPPAGSPILPNETLVFVVDLVSVP